MAQVLVRHLDETTVEHLKALARSHGRSLEAELRLVVEEAARADPVDRRLVARRIRERLAGREHSDSGELQAEDRCR